MSRTDGATGYVEVRLGAIARNYLKLREGTRSNGNGTEVGAVVKANAYGLGVEHVAPALFDVGCRKFFVATLEEGVLLRSRLAAKTDAEIYVFEGLRQGSEALYEEHTLAPVLNTPEQVRYWQRVGAPCAVHVDTGMSRLGLTMEQLSELFATGALRQQLGMQYLMTHLSCADDPEHPQNLAQLDRFEQARELVGDVKVSIANSAGAFLDQRFHGDLIRPGIALYGGNPFSEHENPMEPAASLYARVLQLRQVNADMTVGYGATFHAPAGTRIATVGVGYADGYPRILGNAALVAVRGVHVPVIGAVSMDLTCLDVTDLDADRIAVGDYVEMFGDFVSVDDIAALCSTISYEILTGLNPRLPRVCVE